MLFTLALASTTILLLSTVLLLLAGRHVRVASRILGVVVVGVVCFAGAGVAVRVWALPEDLTWVAAGAVGVACLPVIALLPYWNPIGQAFLGSYFGAALSYLALGGYLTFAPGLSVWGRLASLLLLVLEFFALVISGYFAFEGCDRLCRARDTRRIMPPDPAYLPKVSLQVPAFNEPADMLIETIKSLERIDYPNLEILVVDNNTPDPETWRPVAEYCASRERVRFLHVETDGFKAGALNLVMAEHLDPDVEIIGVVDADYQVDPEYVRKAVGYFADPKVAFVQTPQDYRDYAGDTYLTACYDAYSYFFHASMPSRNQRNSLIFAGTMGLMRRRSLEEQGGWAEWCITEDSETSLRLLKAGYTGVYIEQSMGRGIMPLTFSALKSQRFRWCFGGIQIVRKHWRDLMPWRRSGLTRAQKLDYLFGTGLVWFNDVLYFGFTVVLLVTAYQMFTGQGAFFRPLLGGLVLLPAALLLSGVLRALWSLRSLTGIGVKRSIFALLNWLSLSWTVAMATLRGLVRKEAVFMRTPKEHDGRQNVWTAIRAAKAETFLAAVLSACAIGAAVKGTIFVAGLFLWQGIVYASSPLMSWLSTRTVLTPELERRRQTEEKRERMAALAGYYASGAAALAAVALIAAILILGGAKPGQVPALPTPPGQTPAPTPTVQIGPSPTTGGGTPSPTRSPSRTPTSRPIPTSPSSTSGTTSPATSSPSVEES
ncbi:glycosyltransferase [Allorhizocola rhizosphaerae]|uniref:glycosyltransferase n=1 Tax=Allorhizocola rhizosphaerae TaxID=1872709 RepID=UPI000E3BDEA5|nr:glycosyltransferase [Allorhizocola rhizosphaerae]